MIIPHRPQLERHLVSAILANPTLLLDERVIAFESADILDHTARRAFEMVRNLQATHKPITADSVIAAIEADIVTKAEHATGSKHHPDLDALIEIAVKTPVHISIVRQMIGLVQTDAAARGVQWRAANAAERAELERAAAALEALADLPPSRPEPVAPPPPDDRDAPHAADDDGPWCAPPPGDEDAPHRAEQFKLVKSGPRAGLPALIKRNVEIALRKIGVRLSYNEFSGKKLIDGLDGFGPVIDDAAINRLYLTIEERFRFRPAKDYFYDCIGDICRAHSFHPVRDYLAGLTWDGTPRLAAWLADYFAAEDTVYTRAVGRLVLVAAVRRVRAPGCKFDEMLILEGPQGTCKTTGIAALAVRSEWFGDALQLNADTRRQMEQTAGKWIVEAGELKGMSKGDRFQLKAYLSTQIDEARLAYGRENTVRPRQFVIIGTTNESEDYLGDPTGERRFWPVRVGAVDVARLAADRDQLWAEAAAAEAGGESIRLDSSLWPIAAAEQEARRIGDPLAELLREALGERTGKIRAIDCYRLAGIEPGKASPDQMGRIGHAMRALGWERIKRRFGDGPVWSYARGTAAEREIALEADEVIEHGRPPRYRVRPVMRAA